MLKNINGEKFRIIPSFITILGLTLGIHALQLIYFNKLDKACLCVIIAGILDVLDGKVARYLKVSSKFGGTLDTLADFLNFGVVSGFVIYSKYAIGLDKLYWMCVVVYIICTALRLARFSVIGMENEKFFKGVPAPGAAFLLAFPICLEMAFINVFSTIFLTYLSMFCLLLISFLMLSHFNTISLSRIVVPKKYFALLIILIGIGLNFFYFYRWYCILLIQICYLVAVFCKNK